MRRMRNLAYLVAVLAVACGEDRANVSGSEVVVAGQDSGEAPSEGGTAEEFGGACIDPRGPTVSVVVRVQQRAVEALYRVPCGDLQRVVPSGPTRGSIWTANSVVVLESGTPSEVLPGEPITIWTSGGEMAAASGSTLHQTDCGVLAGLPREGQEVFLELRPFVSPFEEHLGWEMVAGAERASSKETIALAKKLPGRATR